MKKLKSPNHRITESPKRFTLIEVLMVCALLAFLMAIMVGGYSIASSKMAEADCRSTIEKIATALETYKAKTGYYIQAIGDDAVFYMDVPNNAVGAAGVDFTDFIDYQKMLKSGTLELDTDSGRYYLVDPYGTPFWYQCPGRHNRMKFDLESAGPDSSFGYTNNTFHVTVSSADQVADNIKNWE